MPHQTPLNNEDRRSSAPFISGDSFRKLAKFYVDEMRIGFDPQAVKNGDIIFLKPDFCDYFFTIVHPKITSKYILISHNSDFSVPGKYGNMLDDQKLIAWFGQNIDRKHSKLIPIPIGIANRYWPTGRMKILDRIINEAYRITKDIFCYLNVCVSTNDAERSLIVKLFEHSSFCYQPSKRLSWAKYLLDLARSKFILSPEGNGLDCYRTWEVLYMGSFPIVKSSTLDELYKDLPIIIVNSWKEVTKKFLKQKFQEFKTKKFNLDKMYFFFWENKIKQLQKIHQFN